MIVRPATEHDREAIHALGREFLAESPPAPYVDEETSEGHATVDAALTDGLAVLAEQDGEAIGFGLARQMQARLGYVSDLFVTRAARRRGVGRALMQALANLLRERGAEYVALDVDVGDADARAVYARWGFREESLRLVAEVDRLEQRVGAVKQPSFGSIHVQTDDVNAVVRAVRQFVPRLPGGSGGSAVAPPRNGWIAVYDELCDREPPLLRRLARELSDRIGAVVLLLGLEDGEVVRYVLFERGRVVDEYLSVPDFHRPLPPGDAIALAANPTVVARLTGADPARVRAVARTATSPAELPPGHELLAELADALGLEGATHGFAGAADIPGVVPVGPGAES